MQQQQQHSSAAAAEQPNNDLDGDWLCMLPSANSDSDGELAEDVARKPKTRKTKQGKHTSTITKVDLQSVYHLNSEDAAVALGIGLTALKNVCRNHDIPRWPYRKVKRIEQIAAKLLSGKWSQAEWQNLHDNVVELDVPWDNTLWSKLNVNVKQALQHNMDDGKVSEAEGRPAAMAPTSTACMYSTDPAAQGTPGPTPRGMWVSGSLEATTLGHHASPTQRALLSPPNPYQSTDPAASTFQIPAAPAAAAASAAPKSGGCGFLPGTGQTAPHRLSAGSLSTVGNPNMAHANGLDAAHMAPHGGHRQWHGQELPLMQSHDTSVPFPEPAATAGSMPRAQREQLTWSGARGGPYDAHHNGTGSLPATPHSWPHPGQQGAGPGLSHGPGMLGMEPLGSMAHGVQGGPCGMETVSSREQLAGLNRDPFTGASRDKLSGHGAVEQATSSCPDSGLPAAPRQGPSNGSIQGPGPGSGSEAASMPRQGRLLPLVQAWSASITKQQTFVQELLTPSDGRVSIVMQQQHLHSNMRQLQYPPQYDGRPGALLNRSSRALMAPPHAPPHGPLTVPPHSLPPINLHQGMQQHGTSPMGRLPVPNWQCGDQGGTFSPTYGMYGVQTSNRRMHPFAGALHSHSSSHPRMPWQEHAMTRGCQSASCTPRGGPGYPDWGPSLREPGTPLSPQQWFADDRAMRRSSTPVNGALPREAGVKRGLPVPWERDPGGSQYQYCADAPSWPAMQGQVTPQDKLTVAPRMPSLDTAAAQTMSMLQLRAGSLPPDNAQATLYPESQLGPSKVRRLHRSSRSVPQYDASSFSNLGSGEYDRMTAYHAAGVLPGEGWADNRGSFGLGAHTPQQAVSMPSQHGALHTGPVMASGPSGPFDQASPVLLPPFDSHPVSMPMPRVNPGVLLGGTSGQGEQGAFNMDVPGPLQLGSNPGSWQRAPIYQTSSSRPGPLEGQQPSPDPAPGATASEGTHSQQPAQASAQAGACKVRQELGAAAAGQSVPEEVGTMQSADDCVVPALKMKSGTGHQSPFANGSMRDMLVPPVLPGLTTPCPGAPDPRSGQGASLPDRLSSMPASHVLDSSNIDLNSSMTDDNLLKALDSMLPPAGDSQLLFGPFVGTPDPGLAPLPDAEGEGGGLQFPALNKGGGGLAETWSEMLNHLEDPLLQYGALQQLSQQ